MFYVVICYGLFCILLHGSDGCVATLSDIYLHSSSDFILNFVCTEGFSTTLAKAETHSKGSKIY